MAKENVIDTHNVMEQAKRLEQMLEMIFKDARVARKGAETLRTASVRQDPAAWQAVALRELMALVPRLAEQGKEAAEIVAALSSSEPGRANIDGALSDQQKQ